MAPHITGLIGFGALFLLMFLGVPLVFSFIISGIFGFWMLGLFDNGLPHLGLTPFTQGSSYTLATIPLFVLMGNLAASSGLSSDLFSAAHKWAGRLPGGLAISTVFASAGFAACTGSSVASAVTMGKMCLPEMNKYGYSPRLSTGSVVAGGTLAILIPPSLAFIVYAVFTQESIGQLFIAGIFPGILLTILYGLLIVVQVKRNPALGPQGESFTWREKIASLKSVWGMLLLFLTLILGLYFGVFTATEGAGVAAVMAFILVLLRKRFSFKALVDSLQDSVQTTVMILFLVIGGLIFGYFIALSQLPNMLTEWIITLPLPPMGILLMVLLLYLVLGCIMETFAMLVLTLPLLFPTIVALGFDPIWFGVIMVMMIELALITPPVGLLLYVVRGVSGDVPMKDILLGAAPFALVGIVCVLIIAFVPQIALFLPSLMSK